MIMVTPGHNMDPYEDNSRTWFDFLVTPDYYLEDVGTCSITFT
jgi:hypothetical protein